MLHFVEITQNDVFKSISANEVDTYWNELIKKNQGKKILFDDILYCGFYIGNKLAIYRSSFKFFLYASSHNIDINALSGMLFLKTKDDKILIIKRSSKVLRFPDHYSIPGGYLSQLDFDSANIALNIKTFLCTELIEELGLDISPLQVDFIGNANNINNKNIYLYFLAKIGKTSTELKQIISIGKEEVSDVFFLDYGQLKDLMDSQDSKISPVLSLLRHNNSVDIDKHLSSATLSS